MLFISIFIYCSDMAKVQLDSSLCEVDEVGITVSENLTTSLLGGCTSAVEHLIFSLLVGICSGFDKHLVFSEILRCFWGIWIVMLVASLSVAACAIEVMIWRHFVGKPFVTGSLVASINYPGPNAVTLNLQAW